LSQTGGRNGFVDAGNPFFGCTGIMPTSAVAEGAGDWGVTDIRSCIYYLQLVTMAKLFGVSSANCQAEQQFLAMAKLGGYI
jgi:hypothetical protein